jgi:hypothetical protein
MKRLLLILLIVLPVRALAVPKPHVISYGKAMPVKWYVGAGESKAVDLKVRALYVDTRLKEYTVGLPHDVTDRLFVVRRMFRLNDNLPEDGAAAVRWHWVRGGWLLVDRVTGRVSQINLPEFDPLYSASSWYRDYIAYCGVSDDGKRLSAVVAQLGRRKPVLKKPMRDSDPDEMPDSECPQPVWQRQPVRVTFEPNEDQKLTFSVKGHVVDVVNDREEPEEAE